MQGPLVIEENVRNTRPTASGCGRAGRSNDPDLAERGRAAGSVQMSDGASAGSGAICVTRGCDCRQVMQDCFRGYASDPHVFFTVHPSEPLKDVRELLMRVKWIFPVLCGRFFYAFCS